MFCFMVELNQRLITRNLLTRFYLLTALMGPPYAVHLDISITITQYKWKVRPMLISLLTICSTFVVDGKLFRLFDGCEQKIGRRSKNPSAGSAGHDMKCSCAYDNKKPLSKFTSETLKSFSVELLEVLWTAKMTFCFQILRSNIFCLWGLSKSWNN